MTNTATANKRKASDFPILDGVVLPPRDACYTGRSIIDDAQHIAFINQYVAAHGAKRGAVTAAIRERFKLIGRAEHSLDAFIIRMRRKLRQRPLKS